ncbi:MAG: hypothetical protein AABY15_08900 [Nanoarchaeota archaeon]
MAGHLKQHSFTGNTDHNFNGLTNNFLFKLNSSGTGITNSQAYDDGINIAIGHSSPTARFSVKATGDTTGNVARIDGATVDNLFTVKNNGRIGVNVAPSDANRLSVTAGAGLDGAINISASNLADNGYALLAQGSSSSSNYYGLWSDAQGATSNNMAFRGSALALAVTNNYGGQFIARNASGQTIGVYGLATGGDSVNAADSAGVLGINSSDVSTNKKGVWGYLNSNVNNGTGYGGKFEAANAGTNAINYAIHGRANGSFSSATNYAGFFQADGGSDATNYAIVTNGGTNGFGTITPTDMVHINGTTGSTQLRLEKSFTPTSSGNTSGNIGSVAWDDNYFYMKTNTGWGRVVWDYNF